MSISVLRETHIAESERVQGGVFDILIVPGLQAPAVRDLSQLEEWLDLQALDKLLIIRLMRLKSNRGQVAQHDLLADVVDQGSNLLWALHNERRSGLRQCSQIVFICYSFGSFVVKEALFIANANPTFRNIFDSTAGILFLGPIHNECHNGFVKCMKTSIAVELGINTHDRVLQSEQVTKSIENLQRICKQFREMKTSIKVTNLYEDKETRVSKNKVLHKSSTVISRDLAFLDSKNEKLVGADIDHVEISTSPKVGTVYASVVLQHLQDILASIRAQNMKNYVPQSIPNAAGIGGVTNMVALSSPSNLTVIGEESRSNLQALNLFPVVAQPNQVKDNLKLPCHLFGPYQKNPYFVGRDDSIKEIEKSLNPRPSSTTTQATFVLFGTGGMGKTQTSLAYVFGSLHKFQAVLWARADSKAKLAQSFADFAYEIGLVDDVTADQALCQQTLARWFKTAQIPWLVVFDNADSKDKLKLLAEFWPVGDYGSILITSRDEVILGTLASAGKKIGPLKEENAVDLLLKTSTHLNTPANRGYACKIAERVDYVPLGLSQAALFIRINSLSLQDYLEAYSNRQLIQDSVPMPGPAWVYEHSLSTVWNMNFENLDQDTQTLVSILAFLDPDKVKESLISEGASHSKDSRLKFIGGSKSFIKCRAKLSRSVLVYRNEDLQILWMHRLVQETCHLRMSSSSRQEAFELAFDILNQVWPVAERHNRHRPELWTFQQECIPHIASISRYYRESLESGAEEDENATYDPLKPPEAFAELLYNAAWYYYERGQLESAGPLLDIAKLLCEKNLDDPELLLADIFGAYASIDSERNQLQTALENFEKQFEFLYQAFDKGLLQRPHVREALAFGGLANGLGGLDRYAEAEVYYRKCVEAWNEVPGEPTIYEIHLGTCMAWQGKLKEAEDVLMKVIRDREAKFGPRDTTSYRTGIAYYAMGTVLDMQRRYPEGFEFQKASLDILLATLGDRHHSTADAYYKVGWHFHNQKNYTDAREYIERALEIYHNDTLYRNEIARGNYKLGVILQDMGKSEEGTKLKIAAESLQKSIMGPKWKPAIDEGSYDRLVNFWSR